MTMLQNKPNLGEAEWIPGGDFAERSQFGGLAKRAKQTQFPAGAHETVPGGRGTRSNCAKQSQT
jgi:hypothetical protein